jgi:hypothetical protein
MIYLTIKADYEGEVIKNTYDNGIFVNSSNLSDELCDQIKKWNINYIKIIPMDYSDRILNNGLISDLDEEGVNICNSILVELGSETKIQYYSEGKMKLITMGQA